MEKRILMTLALTAGLMVTGAQISFSEDAMKMSDTKAGQTVAAAAAAATDSAAGAADKIDVGNKICPMEGMAIEDGKGFPVEYKGKIYHVCSAACVTAFNKDPEAAVKKVEEELSKKKDDAAAAVVDKMDAMKADTGTEKMDDTMKAAEDKK